MDTGKQPVEGLRNRACVRGSSFINARNIHAGDIVGSKKIAAEQAVGGLCILNGMIGTRRAEVIS